MDPTDPSQPGPGLIPYETAHQFWSDAATKERWLALPDGAQITIGEDGIWALPTGSVIVKQFSRGGEPIETRVYMNHSDGWAGYSYAWNATRTDAEYNPVGRIVYTSTGAWPIPSSQQCIECHTAAAGITLGLRTEQFASLLYYPSTGRLAHQLATLANIDLFTNPPIDPMEEPGLPPRESPSATNEELARTYLDVNCSSCHRPNSDNQGRARFDARRTTPLSAMGLCDEEPDIAGFGLEGARLIAPGNPDASVVMYRMNRRDINGMPPAGSTLITDPVGIDAVTAWIASLNGCQ